MRRKAVSAPPQPDKAITAMNRPIPNLIAKRLLSRIVSLLLRSENLDPIVPKPSICVSFLLTASHLTYRQEKPLVVDATGQIIVPFRPFGAAVFLPTMI